MIEFFIGLIVGSLFGVTIMALISSGGNDD